MRFSKKLVFRTISAKSTLSCKKCKNIFDAVDHAEKAYDLHSKCIRKYKSQVNDTFVTDDEDEETISPLYKACMSGNRKIVRLLLKLGAKIDDEASIVTVQNCHFRCTKVLLENGKNPNIHGVYDDELSIPMTMLADIYFDDPSQELLNGILLVTKYGCSYEKELEEKSAYKGYEDLIKKIKENLVPDFKYANDD